MSSSVTENMEFLKAELAMDTNFDIIYRVIQIGDKQACLYNINGMYDDEILQKLLTYFMEMKPEQVVENPHELIKVAIPYISVDLKNMWDNILTSIMSGLFALFIDGYDRCILLDARSYPIRGVEEPEKDKVLRGSRDGFVETIVSNTALIRRRIRSTELRMELLNAGKSSKTDIVLCYMNNRVDQKFLSEVRERINSLQVDALSLNQESLAECLYKSRWYNPFPKFRYSERPDTASAQILEGNLIILVDTAPQAMITPTTIFDIIEDTDDYYFPPITGTYLRLARLVIAILTYLITPTYLLLMLNKGWIPSAFNFIKMKEVSNIPIIWQFLALELAIDGLKLAAVNTPSMLSTPLSVMAALVLGEFSVKSGWFNAEVMLYMAFVAISSYTQSNYELGYALKFMRIINLILTYFFGIYGFIASLILVIVAIVTNKTISGKSYAYPLFPFDWEQIKQRFFRHRLPPSKK